MTKSLSLRSALVAVLLTVAACGGPREPAPLTGPLPGPGMAAQRVMVFPVQIVGVQGDPERELVYALEARRGSGGWILPEELRERLARSPGLDVPADDLPVAIFLSTEVRRVGDPLYGIIRRAAALTDATWALIPVAVRYRAATTEESGAIVAQAALIEVVSGRVRWLGMEESPADTPDDPGSVARVMDMLASRLLPGG